MKDLVKFIACMLAIAPCALIVNCNENCLWLNVAGVAYLFCLIGFCMGHSSATRKMLDTIEKFEDGMLNES